MIRFAHRRVVFSRRNLRLASGLVMFSYVTVHFVDHALGLVSLYAAELALWLAVNIWHEPPGTFVLYGAVAVHVSLALLAVYERRTLRMPPLEALRIALGFGMPLLLIGHVVATRIAAETYGLAANYQRIVWTLWLSDGEGRQLALLAPGWLHGCLGLDYAFGHRRGWRRLRPALFGAALLLPVLAGLGFLSMGRELAERAADDPSWAATIGLASDAQRVALARLRDHVLTGYFMLIGLAFGAREVRRHVERLRRSVVRITYPRRAVEVPRGWTLLEASRGFGIPHVSMCGGRARCSTCRVRIVGGADSCPPASALEQRTLERIHAPADVRLACQLRPVADLAIVPLVDPGDPAAAAAPVAAVERSVAVLGVRIAGWRSLRGSAASPHDLLYALDRFHAVVGDAVGAAGGWCSSIDDEGAVAVFGLAGELGSACRQALVAARAIDDGLRALDERLSLELGLVAECVLVLHAGPAVIAMLGYGGERTRMPIGETVDAARRLCRHAARSRHRWTVTRVAAGAAGLVLDAGAWSTAVDPVPEFATAERVPLAAPA